VRWPGLSGGGLCKKISMPASEELEIWVAEDTKKRVRLCQNEDDRSGRETEVRPETYGG
jgi:hypothetical protein